MFSLKLKRFKEKVRRSNQMNIHEKNKHFLLDIKLSDELLTELWFADTKSIDKYPQYFENKIKAECEKDDKILLHNRRQIDKDNGKRPHNKKIENMYNNEFTYDERKNNFFDTIYTSESITHCYLTKNNLENIFNLHKKFDNYIFPENTCIIAQYGKLYESNIISLSSSETNPGFLDVKGKQLNHFTYFNPKMMDSLWIKLILNSKSANMRLKSLL